MLPLKTATMPSSISSNSAALHQTITDRLLNRSARNPAGVANGKYGRKKQIAPSERASDGLMTSFPKGTASQRNMLSLNTPKNCVSSRPTKLRELRPSSRFDANVGRLAAGMVAGLDSSGLRRPGDRTLSNVCAVISGRRSELEYITPG